MHGAIIAVCLFGYTILHDGALAARNNTSCWIGAGAGFSTKFVGKNLHLSVNRGIMLASLRLNANIDFDSDRYYDFAVLAGVVGVTDHVVASIALGPAQVSGNRYKSSAWSNDEEPTRIGIDTCLGFALEGQIYYKIGRFFGVGFYAYGDLNREQSFGGLLFSIIVGKMPGE